MIPAAHLLSGYLVGKWTPAENAGRGRVLSAAVIGSMAPDVDVALGLLGGWAGAGLHRGATHSFLGGAILAGLIAVFLERVWPAPQSRIRRPLFLAALFGVLTHIFWDWLNPWGVIALWPWMHSFRGNLLHEGDLYAPAILVVAAALVWRGRNRAAAVTLAILLPVYFAVQWQWRDHARDLARMELSGRRVGVYPTGDLRCGWVVLFAGERDLTADCVTGPLATHLRPLYRVTPASDFFTRESQQSPAVREFLEKIPFPFAQVQPDPGGGATVFWRDLRLACQEGPTSDPAGLQLRLDAGGHILSVRHHWWLRVW